MTSKKKSLKLIETLNSSMKIDSDLKKGNLSSTSHLRGALFVPIFFLQIGVNYRYRLLIFPIFMASADKEKILIELRNYHTTPFADVLSSDAMNLMRVKFATLEDEIIAMILGLINGKVEYSSFNKELVVFQTSVNALNEKSEVGKAERALFISKIEQLLEITKLAEAANFRLRPQRFRRPVAKPVGKPVR